MEPSAGASPTGATATVVVMGEALIDLVPDGEGNSFASPWQAQTAGGPLNSAIALARLGQSVEFVGPVASDPFGQQIRQHLATHGVGTTLTPSGVGPTAMAILSLDHDGKASYHFHLSNTGSFVSPHLPLPALGPSQWLHLGSLALIVEPGATVLREWVGHHQGRWSLDLNVRPVVEPDPKRYAAMLQPWLELAASRHGVIKASDEDFSFLAGGFGLRTESELSAALVRGTVAGVGIPVVVTTQGPDGARAEQPNGVVVTAPGRRCDVVDTVGAGDTFMAGFLDHVVRQPVVSAGQQWSADLLTRSLERGIAAASLVVGRRGAQPPTRDEVEQLLADD